MSYWISYIEILNDSISSIRENDELMKFIKRKKPRLV